MCHMSQVTCQMSHATCQIPYVRCYLSCVVCQMSHVTCHLSLTPTTTATHLPLITAPLSAVRSGQEEDPKILNGMRHTSQKKQKIANFCDTSFDQRSPGHLEVGVLRWHGHTHRHGNSMTDPTQRAESVQIFKETQVDQPPTQVQGLLGWQRKYF